MTCAPPPPACHVCATCLPACLPATWLIVGWRSFAVRRESKAEPEPEPEPEPEVEEEEDTGGMCVAPNLTAPAPDE